MYIGHEQGNVNREQKGLCMKGGIYSNQTCPICGGKFKDNRYTAVCCSKHPKQEATRLVVRFGKLTKRFRSYEEAFQFLNGVRYETSQGKFDIRDYRKNNPLGFENLVEDFLKSKRRLKAVDKYRQRLQKAVDAWGNTNVKDIGYSEIENLLLDLLDQNCSTKYVFDIKCCLETFFRWLVKSGQIRLDQMPLFPEVKYTLAYRSIVNKETQLAILDQIHRSTWHINPRIYIGCMFLATYVNIRPGELRNIKEKDIELENKRILISHPKEQKPKYVYLIEEDVELLRSMPRGFPDMYFFRHQKGNGGAKPGQQFGKDYIYKWWKKACANLDIAGVDLYGGTKHSSAVDLRKRHSPEAVKRATMHSTNKAFERYLQLTADELTPIYADARRRKLDNGLITDFKGLKKRN